MKQVLLFGTGAMLCFGIHGQEVSVDQIPGSNSLEKMNHFYQNITSDMVGAPVLAEKAMLGFDLTRFSGSPDSDTINFAQLKSTIHGFHAGQLGNERVFQGLAHFQNQFKQVAGNQTFPLVLIETQVGSFKQEFPELASLPQVELFRFSSTGALVDRSPHLEKFNNHTFLAMGFAQKSIPQDCQFILPRNLIQGLPDIANSDRLEVDFSDGVGFRNVEWDTPYPLVFKKPGSYVGTFKLTKLGKAPQWAYFHFKVEGSPQKIPFKSGEFIEWYDPQSSAVATFKLGDGNSQLKHPVIVVEGLDLNGDMNKDLIFKTGNEGSEERNLILRLLNRNLDVGYLDFGEDGLQSMRHHAEVLRRLLHYINHSGIKEGNAANTIVGLDAGGVIARYCLSAMEKIYCEEHHVKTNISYDAPHQGTNIPVALQFVVEATKEFQRDLFMDSDVDKIWHYPIMRELLINHVDYAGGHPEHRAFYAELNDLGYPKKARNIAAVMGTTYNNVIEQSIEDELKNSSSPEALQEVFKMEQKVYKGSGMVVDIYAKTLSPSSSNAKVGKFRVLYRTIIVQTLIFGEAIKLTVDVPIYNRNFDYWKQSVADIAPGGFDYTQKTMADKYNEENVFNSEFYNPSRRMHQSLVPVYSATDLAPELAQQRYVSRDFEDIIAHNQTPFDRILYKDMDRNFHHASGMQFPVNYLDFLQDLVDEISEGLVEGILPSVLDREFNFTEELGAHIGSVKIKDKGVLHLNANKKSGYLQGEKPPVNSSLVLRTYDPKISSCGQAFIEVEENGVLSLGDNQMLNNSKLNLSNESQLIVRQGGVLRLYNNSSIQLDGNSTLLLEKGSIIHLVGEDTEINAKGTTLIQGLERELLVRGKGTLKINHLNFRSEARNALGIEGGAHVVFGPQSTFAMVGPEGLRVEGDSSSIEIQGFWQLAPGMDFVFASVSGAPLGKMILNPSQPDFLQADGTNSITFRGDGPDDVTLDVRGEVIFPGGLTVGHASEGVNVEAGSTLGQLNLSQLCVDFKSPGAQLISQASGVFENVIFQYKQGTGPVVRTLGQQNFQMSQCQFNRVDFVASQFAGGHPMIAQDVRLDHANFEVDGNHTLSSNFQLEGGAHYFLRNSGSGTSKFTQFDLPGNEFQDRPQLVIHGSGNTFLEQLSTSNNEAPLELGSYGTTLLKCNSFANHLFAVEVKAGTIRMGNAFGMGKNSFTAQLEEGSLIRNVFPRSSSFDFNQGGNRFGTNNENAFAILDAIFIDGDCTEREVAIPADGNAWRFGSDVSDALMGGLQNQVKPDCPGMHPSTRAYLVDGNPQSYSGCKQVGVLGQKSYSAEIIRLAQLLIRTSGGVTSGQETIHWEELGFGSNAPALGTPSSRLLALQSARSWIQGEGLALDYPTYLVALNGLNPSTVQSENYLFSFQLELEKYKVLQELGQDREAKRLAGLIMCGLGQREQVFLNHVIQNPPTQLGFGSVMDILGEQEKRNEALEAYEMALEEMVDDLAPEHFFVPTTITRDFQVFGGDCHPSVFMEQNGVEYIPQITTGDQIIQLMMDKPGELEVWDLLGRPVGTFHLSEGNNQVDFEKPSWASTFFICRFSPTDGTAGWVQRIRIP